MKKHGRASLHAEVGGMLVGNLCRDEGVAYLFVEAAIVGEHTDGNAASVTFTAETWAHVWKIQEDKHENTKIIGWYHTHPGFGIFLSHMDLFICEHTFNAQHQVAYVYDPHSDEDGWFVWKHSRPTKMKKPPLIIEDEPALPATIPIRSRILHASADKIVIPSDDRVSKWATLSNLSTYSTFISTVLLLICAICLVCIVLQGVQVQKDLYEMQQLKIEVEELKRDNQRIEKNLWDNVDEIHRWIREHSHNPPQLIWEPQPTHPHRPTQEEPQQQRSNLQIFIDVSRPSR